MTQINFNPNEHEPQGPLTVLPRAWYAMRIVKGEIQKSQKDPRNQMLELEFEIDPNYYPDTMLHGRKVWTRLNLWHQSPKAQAIANGLMSALCQAMGHNQVVGQIEELYNRTVAVLVSVRPARGEFEESNDVKGFDAVAKRIGVGAPVTAQTSTTAPVAPPPAHPPAQPNQGAPGTQAMPPQQPPAQAQPPAQPPQQPPAQAQPPAQQQQQQIPGTQQTGQGPAPWQQ